LKLDLESKIPLWPLHGEFSINCGGFGLPSDAIGRVS
jgi:hypothetical protein